LDLQEEIYASKEELSEVHQAHSDVAMLVDRTIDRLDHVFKSLDLKVSFFLFLSFLSFSSKTRRTTETLFQSNSLKCDDDCDCFVQCDVSAMEQKADEQMVRNMVRQMSDRLQKKLVCFSILSLHFHIYIDGVNVFNHIYVLFFSFSVCAVDRRGQGLTRQSSMKRSRFWKLK
jgi:hypothetical protein